MTTHCDDAPALDRRVRRRETSTSETREVLLHGQATVASFIVAPDESFVLCADEDYAANKTTLRRLPLWGSDAPDVVATLEGQAQFPCIDPARGCVDVLQTSTEQDGRLFRVDLEGGDVALEFPEEAGRRHFHGTQFTWYSRHRRFLVTADGATAYYVRTSGGDDAEFAELREVDLAAPALRTVAPGLGGDVGHMALTPDERFVVYLLLERGFARLRAYDRQAGKRKDL